MPHKDLTVTQDETLTGGLCLITMDPESNFLLVEQLAQARDQTAWNACMAPALAQCNCRVMQSTSDEAPGLLASVAHSLEAHHSPDLFHVQHELVKAVSGPMATKERGPLRPLPTPQSSSNGCKVPRKARVKSPQSVVQGVPQSTP